MAFITAADDQAKPIPDRVFGANGPGDLPWVSQGN